jgi:WD40 repeat protein
VRAVAFSPEATRLASGDRAGQILLQEVATRRRIGRLIGHAMRVNTLRFFPDDCGPVSTSYDRTVRIWRGEPDRR